MPNLTHAPVFTSNSSLLRSACVDPSIDINPHRLAGAFIRAGGYADDLYQDAALDYLERKARGATMIAPMFSVNEAQRRMWRDKGFIRSRKGGPRGAPRLMYAGRARSDAEIELASGHTTRRELSDAAPIDLLLANLPAPDADVERALDMRNTALRLRDSLKHEDHRALVDLVLEGHVDACTVSENNPLFGDMRSLSRTVRNSAHLSAIVAGAFNV